MSGGATNNGTVFQITPAGKLTLAAHLQRAPTARRPISALVQAADGNFYGTTLVGRR